MEVQCKLCEHFVRLEEFDNHYKKCSCIKYIQSKMKELYNQDIKYNELYLLDKVELSKKYFWVLNRIYEVTSDPKEKKRIENILYGTDYSLKDCM